MPEHRTLLSNVLSLPHGSGETESQISPLIESIRAVMAKIDGIDKEAEPAFLQLGMDLQSFYSKSDQVIRLTQSVVKETGMSFYLRIRPRVPQPMSRKRPNRNPAPLPPLEKRLSHGS